MTEPAIYNILSATSVVSEESAIYGGYYIKPRKSPVAEFAPCVREVWDYLLNKCNYKDSPETGLKKGQCLVRISEIQDALKWFVGFRKMTYSKTQCEDAYEALRKTMLITTVKTTRGLIITICKYDYYQSMKPSEDYNENYAVDNKKTTTTSPLYGIQDNTGNKRKEKKGVPEEDVLFAKRIIAYLNQQAKKAFQVERESNHNFIYPRMKEGYTEADFKKVIDLKTAEWLHNPKMVTHLCPSTLFGNKFETYLNSVPTVNQPTEHELKMRNAC